MISITNEKVAGFDPRWAAFRGFSLLFDNPGMSLTTSGALAYIDCDVDGDKDLLLYKAFRNSLSNIGIDILTNTYLFCPLPPASYHVTVWDGLNDGSVDHVVAAHRSECERFLQGLPLSLCESDLFPEIAASKVVSTLDWNIQFRFGRLEKWSNVSIVARLAPGNDASAEAIGNLTAARATLTADFERRFKIRPQETYVPHVTLGYFANRDLAEQATPFMESWNATFQQGTTDLMMEVHRVSLYGFTDMATFFKGLRV
jgi:hypothetical protein